MTATRPEAGSGRSAGQVTSLLRNSASTTGVGFAQAIALTAETALVGRLGTDALAAYALVLPLALLMNMMSTGAMGGGVSSAVARTLGAGRRDEASALILHALLIGGGLGCAFSLLVFLFGQSLFAAMGAQGGVLTQATHYANLLFIGVPFYWLLGTLASVLRGTGQMGLPARVTTIAWLLEPALAAVLMFGLGPIPALGLAGLPIAYTIVFVIAAGVLLRAVMRGAGGITPRFRVPLRRTLFARILAVGAIASLMATLANMTTVLVTVLVAPFGPAAIAAYGIATRLEFLMIPLAFGIGATLTSQVGRRVGAGDWEGARRLAWLGGWLVCAACGVIGLVVALWPDLWIALFTRDPQVIEVARLALRIIAPAYALLGLGMALYFASQGAGRMRWPLAASFTRIAIAAGGGALAAGPLGSGLPGVFFCVSAGLVAYGVLVACGVRAAVWRA